MKKKNALCSQLDAISAEIEALLGQLDAQSFETAVLEQKDQLWQQQIKTLLEQSAYQQWNEQDRLELETHLSRLADSHSRLITRLATIRLELEAAFQKQNRSHKAAREYLKHSYHIEP